MAFEGNRTVRRDNWIAGFLLVVAVALFAMPPEYQTATRDGIRETVFRPFLAAQSDMAAWRVGRVDLDDVRAERDSLTAVVAATAALMEENRRLRSLLALGERAGDRFATAQLVRLLDAGTYGTFFLNVGSEQGVRPGSAVVAAGGLLGVVREVGEGYALAVDWTHPEFRASVMTDGGDAYGIAEPRPGRFREESSLALVGAPFHSDIPAGTRIVTSGQGGVLPRGIPVGTVIGIEEADTGWRKSYFLRPAVRLESVMHVLVALPPEGAVRVADLSDIWDVPAPSLDEAAASDGGN